MFIVINTGHIEKVSQENMDKRYKLPGFLSRKNHIFVDKLHAMTNLPLLDLAVHRPISSVSSGRRSNK